MRGLSAKAPQRKFGLALSATLVFAAGVALRGEARAAQEIPPAHPAVPAGAGQPAADDDAATGLMVGATCAGCHDFQRVAMQHMDATQWRQKVTEMIRFGADVAPEEVPKVADYLTRHYGPEGGVKPAS